MAHVSEHRTFKGTPSIDLWILEQKLSALIAEEADKLNGETQLRFGATLDQGRNVTADTREDLKQAISRAAKAEIDTLHFTAEVQATSVGSLRISIFLTQSDRSGGETSLSIHIDAEDDYTSNGFTSSIFTRADAILAELSSTVDASKPVSTSPQNIIPSAEPSLVTTKPNYRTFKYVRCNRHQLDEILDNLKLVGVVRIEGESFRDVSSLNQLADLISTGKNRPFRVTAGDITIFFNKDYVSVHGSAAAKDRGVFLTICEIVEIASSRSLQRLTRWAVVSAVGFASFVVGIQVGNTGLGKQHSIGGWVAGLLGIAEVGYCVALLITLASNFYNRPRIRWNVDQPSFWNRSRQAVTVAVLASVVTAVVKFALDRWL